MNDALLATRSFARFSGILSSVARICVAGDLMILICTLQADEFAAIGKFPFFTKYRGSALKYISGL
jgi:hypothetical protein